ncbi:MAG: MMPL family transporter [Myxococcota bacterium]|nr:MMPL family transporter [Myxococcota bacterium]
MPGSPSERFAAWLDRHRIAILVASLVLAIAGGVIASQMPLKSDLTSLLPSSKRSVRDLHAIQERARPFGTLQIIIESADAAARARAGAALLPRLAALDPALVQQVSADDGALRRHAWEHRYLFAKLQDLVEARDALRARIERGTLQSNPLFIDLDDDNDDPAAAGAGAPGDRLADLEGKLADAEQAAKAPPLWVSPDGRLQLIAVQTTFAASDAGKARRLTAEIERAIVEVRAEVPGVTFGLSGNITLTMYEHDSVLEGMALSALITIGVCGLAMLLYYRSALVVASMLWALGVGLAATFAMARLTVGHLNVMTAFLFAIVVGNGINPGIIVVARYLEELRAGKAPKAAVAAAMAGALHGTLAAAATSAVAYGSLLITDFRGFRQFGAIAGAGMALTWIATFTVLPALLFVVGRRWPRKPGAPPAIGAVLDRLLPHRHPRLVMAVGVIVTLAATVISLRFIVDDPFLRDWRDLQSSTPAIRETREIDARVRAALDTGSQLSGQAYQVVIAVANRDEVGPVVAGIRTADAARPAARRWTQDVWSIEDLVPAQQPEKLAVLAEIRSLIDDPKLQATASDADRAMLAKLRPPDVIPTVGDRDVPRSLAWPFIERDGSIGRLIVVRGAKRFDSFNVDHRLDFAGEVRRLALPPAALVAGEPLVVADIIEVMERDAPKMIVFSVLGSVLGVILVLGIRRHSLVTIGCGMAGVMVMIATCFLVGLRVHFLDLIALPITIGIGIDYAVNLAARDAQDGERGISHLLRTTGGAVVLCSFTTTVGYGTLMLSANGGIRAFGFAALIGEIACVLMALIVAPVWLALQRSRRTRSSRATQPGPGARSSQP